MLELLFPKRCPICGEIVLPKGKLFHAACLKKASFIREPFCINCGREIEEEGGELCRTCKSSKFAFDSGRCTFNYRGETAKAIHVLKNFGTCEYAEFFAYAAVYRHRLFLDRIKPEAIVPVPLHKKKLRKRGFNQAELIAEGITAITGIPTVNLLKKTVNTKDQKSLDREHRKRNLSGAFDVSDALKKSELLPESVLIVDDIFTTGSTINACAAVLKKYGIKKVYFICAAAGASDLF